MKLKPRLNLLTGDNGLGKSFLLDVAWWALTRKWPHDLNPRLTSGYSARPTNPKIPAKIKFGLTTQIGESKSYESQYSPRDESWLGLPGRPYNPGLVIYAHADGAFSIWDPARNYWSDKQGVDVQERLPGYVFSTQEVWNGLTINIAGKPTRVCKGLLDDWSVWIREKGVDAKIMVSILLLLSPPGEPIEIGPLVRLSVNDAQDIPTIRTSYGHTVPIVHASSGVRRIIALAYIFMWSWREHRLATTLLGENSATQVIVLFDEIESHLHPKWQRSILESLLFIAEKLYSNATVQLVAATHSPLILASAEPLFDPKQDAWFDLDHSPLGAGVTLESRPFVRRGTAGRWLTSPAFDLKSEGRSLEAERAIAETEKLLERHRNGESLSVEYIEEVDTSLRKVLSDVDRFWVRWSMFVDEWKDQQSK